MTNQEWLATVSPDEWMKTIDWLFHDYGKQWTDSYLAIKNWLTEEKGVEKSEWLYTEDEFGRDGWRCKECGFFIPCYYDCHKSLEFISEYQFCPKCRAQMKSQLEKIKRIRYETGCPYWAIKECLELEHGCEDKAIKRLEKIYAWYYNLGDNPDLCVKRKEEALRAETIVESKTDLKKED